MSDVAVRRLTGADVEAYRAIRLDTLRFEPGYFGTLLEDEAARPAEAFGRVLEADTVLGAFAGAGMAGVVRVHLHTGAKERHKAGLHGLFVRPAFRGQGVGTVLLRAAMAAAGAEGRERMVLRVAAENAVAIRMYERAGFRAFGTEPRARKHEGVHGDVTSMGVTLAGADGGGATPDASP